MKPAIGLIIASLALTGCSETKFADMLDSGKNSPDETQVRTSRPLTMPPDMQLSQPGTVQDDGNLNAPIAAQRVAVAPDIANSGPAVSAAPDYSTAAAAANVEEPVGKAKPGLVPEASRLKQSNDFWASERAPAPGDQLAAKESSRQQSFWSSNTNDLFGKGKHNAFWDADPNAPKTKPLTRDEALAKLGISKTKPDGTPKTTNELDNELKAAVLAEKRKSNPDYGTINNLGNIFTDG